MRHQIIKSALLASSCLSFQSVFAADNILEPIIVTATRTPQTADQALASVSVITRKDIEKTQAKSVAELLRNQAGIHITQNGGYGKNSSIFIRGTESNHVLVLVDGIRASSATLGKFAWSNFSPEQIERIEIVRGPRASLYGSDAIGGVIQIFTRNNKGIHATIGMGSDSTRQLDIGHGGGENWRYSIEAGRFETNGIPSAVVATENDGFDNNHLALALTGQPIQDGELKVRVTHSQGSSELDPSTGDIDFKNRVFSGELNHQASSNWTQKFSYGNTLDENESHSPTSPSTITTKRNSFSWQNDIILNEDLLTLGVDYYQDHATKDDSGVIDETINNKAAFIQHQFKSLNSDWIAGARYDSHNKFGHHSTWNLAWGKDLTPSLRITASYGKAFKAPTVNDLFWPNSSDIFLGTTYISQGNPNINPEKSSTSEIGLHKMIGQKGSLSANLYHTKINNLIDWTTTQTGANEYTSMPSNTDNVTINGLDLASSWLMNDWNLAATATLLDAKDDVRDQQLDRRPIRTVTFTGSRSFGNHDIFTELVTASKRLDRNGSAELRGYGVMNVNYQYNIKKNMAATARIENLFDKEYVLATSFSGDWNTLDRSVFISLQYKM